MSIKYNLLNLPSQMQYSLGHTVSYLYDANGIKRNVRYTMTDESIVVPIGTTVEIPKNHIVSQTSTDYCGNVIYENGVLNMILTNEGFITMNGAVPTYHYYLKDHQGNNRVVFNQNGVIEQTNHYYPSGLAFGEGISTSGQRYKYNGKELDKMNGLNWYDYGARHYDAAIVRWGTIDPLAEKYYSISPYAYCGNNPMKYVDLRGDSLTLAGSASDAQATANTYNTGLGGCYTVTTDANGKMSISPVAGTDPNNMTAEQKAYYESLNKVISGTDGMTTINVVNGTSVVIGDVIAKTIDIGDIQALGNGKDINQGSALLHETIEQYGVQVKGQGPKSAHLKASGAERLVTGSYVDPLNRYNEGGKFRIPILDPITESPIKTVIIYVNGKGNVTGIKR